MYTIIIVIIFSYFMSSKKALKLIETRNIRLTHLLANTSTDTVKALNKYKKNFAAACMQWHKTIKKKTNSAQEVQNQSTGDICLSEAILIINGASAALGSSCSTATAAAGCTTVGARGVSGMACRHHARMGCLQ